MDRDVCWWFVGSQIFHTRSHVWAFYWTSCVVLETPVAVKMDCQELEEWGGRLLQRNTDGPRRTTSTPFASNHFYHCFRCQRSLFMLSSLTSH